MSDRLCDLPPEIVQQVVDMLSPDILRYLAVTSSWVSPLAINAYYNDVLITKFHRGNDSSFDIDDEEEQLIHFQYWNNYPDDNRQCIHLLPVRQTKINGPKHFIEFAKRYPALRFILLTFCDMEDLDILNRLLPQALLRAQRIQLALCWSDINTVELLGKRFDMLNNILQLPYNFYGLNLSIFNYSHLPIDYSMLRIPARVKCISLQEKSHDDSIRGSIVDRLEFFDRISQLRELAINNIRLQLLDLELLPKSLRRLLINLLLLFLNSTYNRLNLPLTLLDLEIVSCSLDNKLLQDKAVIDISHLNRLETLKYTGGIFEDLRSLKLPANLHNLHLFSCDRFRQLDGLECLPQLRSLVIRDCPYFLYIHTITSFSNFPDKLQTILLENRRRISPDRHRECLREFAADLSTDGRRSYLMLGKNCRLPRRLQNFELAAFNTVKVDSEFVLPDTIQNLHLKELGGFTDFTKWKLPESILNIDLLDQKVGSIDSFAFPSKLRSINLDRNDLMCIRNTNLPSFTNLTTLYLGSNELKFSSSFNSQLPPSLRMLDLLSNHLQDCIITNCPKLHTLRLYNNRIGGILSRSKFNVPDSVVVLDLLRNKIEGFDRWFKFPTQLRDLNVLGNYIQVLNATFFDNLPENLIHLNMNYNNISIQLEERVRLKRIKTLSLRDNNMSVEKLPLFENGGLKKLDVGNN